MHEDIYNISGLSNPSKDKARRLKIERVIRTNLTMSCFCSRVVLKALESRKKTTKKNTVQKQNDVNSTKLVVR